ncbi:MAG: ABC transporter ATP-binding protein [Fimbriiglobus sp.]
MIELRSITIHQGRFALTDYSLTVAKGEHVALMGPTGCGKTTILEVLVGLRLPTSGSVWLAGRDVTHLPPAERGIGYVPQDAAIFRSQTVFENLAFGLTIRKRPTTLVAALAERLHLAHKLEDSARDLSGGEAQRLALGRALVWEPSLLLLDEPFHALDASTQTDMLRLLEHEQARRDLTILQVAHHPDETPPTSRRIFLG